MASQATIYRIRMDYRDGKLVAHYDATMLLY